MYAVIQTGGKQYRVSKDDVIKVEKLAGTAGDVIELGNVTMIADGGNVTLGAPLIDGATVSAEVLGQDRAEKITVFKKKRRHHYRRTQGHQQPITVLKITGINAAGGKKKTVAAKSSDDGAAAKKTTDKDS